MPTYFDIAMSLKIELGKTANISSPVYVNGKLVEKVDDSRGTGRKREP